VDFGELLGGIGTFDLLVILFFFAFFVLGYIQGTIRRLLGIASVLFSFLLAANLMGPLGGFLAQHWEQYPTQYSHMIAFGTIFLAAVIAFTVIIQGFYKTQPLFEKARFADELIGGVLGLLQAAILLGAVIIVLDSFYRIPGIPANFNELPGLRAFWTAMDASQTANVFRDTTIPVFFTAFGLFIPNALKVLYPGGGAG
jgi:uncharacterized membrane protein required for colicin V production